MDLCPGGYGDKWVQDLSAAFRCFTSATHRRVLGRQGHIPMCIWGLLSGRRWRMDRKGCGTQEEAVTKVCLDDSDDGSGWQYGC